MWVIVGVVLIGAVVVLAMVWRHRASMTPHRTTATLAIVVALIVACGLAIGRW